MTIRLLDARPLFSILCRLAVATCLSLGATACGIYEYDDTPPEPEPEAANAADGVFGRGGLFGPGENFGDEYLGTGESGRIGVNAFLWCASLDTVSFMPIVSVDPFGGVIISDWHASDASPNERFKMNVYILGRALRADGVRVSIFRQVRTERGLWRDAGVPDEMNTKIEDAILTKARQLRHGSLANR